MNPATLGRDGQNVTELYARFLRAIEQENSKDRFLSAKRMRTFFFWCLGVPLVVFLAATILIRVGAFPSSLRGALGWILILFPVLYSVFFLFSEVIRDAPRVLRLGGVGNVLGQFEREQLWRQAVTDQLRSQVGGVPAQWMEITRLFRADLDSLRDRYRYLSVLSGAVFFFLMTGLDVLEDLPRATTAADGPLGYFSLLVFSLLFYLSGTQSVRILSRFLPCAESLSKGAT